MNQSKKDGKIFRIIFYSIILKFGISYSKLIIYKNINLLKYSRKIYLQTYNKYKSMEILNGYHKDTSDI